MGKKVPYLGRISYHTDWMTWWMTLLNFQLDLSICCNPSALLQPNYEVETKTLHHNQVGATIFVKIPTDMPSTTSADSGHIIITKSAHRLSKPTKELIKHMAPWSPTHVVTCIRGPSCHPTLGSQYTSRLHTHPSIPWPSNHRLESYFSWKN
jgi:hypothetical protein